MRNTHHQERREALRQLLAKGPAATQGLIVEALSAAGFDATQSSVSRDLREIGAIKTSQGYEIDSADDGEDEQISAISALLRDMSPAGPNLLVIKTGIGAAQRVALALDRCNWPEVVGNIGGDDTVFVATASGAAQKSLITKIERAARA